MTEAEKWQAEQVWRYLQQRAEEDRLLAEIKDFSVEGLMRYWDERLHGKKNEPTQS